MSTQSRDTGFTLIEFMMVVGISVILITGLSAVIEIPRMALEQRETGQRVSAVDRTLSVLDRDIRFARDVRVKDGDRTLEIDAADGQTIVYRWSGSPGDPVIRTDAVGDASVARGVEGCRFVLKQSPKVVATGLTLPRTDTVIETASFSGYVLQSGYSWSIGGSPPAGGSPTTGLGVRPKDIVGGVLATVTQTVGVFGISDLRRPGFFIEPMGLDADAGSCATFRARLRRYGTGDLQVRIYEAQNKNTAEPQRNKLFGLGVAPNASLPGTFMDVVIPLTSVSRLKNQKCYFVELSSDRGDFAAEIQVNTVSDVAAIVTPNGGLTRSLDSGATFAPFTASLSTSQAPFSLTVVLSEPLTDSAAATYGTVYITTAVSLELQLETPDGVETLEAAFPLQNHLAGL